MPGPRRPFSAICLGLSSTSASRRRRTARPPQSGRAGHPARQAPRRAFRVVTTGNPAAMYSRIFRRVPEPSNTGATPRCRPRPRPAGRGRARSQGSPASCDETAHCRRGQLAGHLARGQQRRHDFAVQKIDGPTIGRVLIEAHEQDRLPGKPYRARNCARHRPG